MFIACLSLALTLPEMNSYKEGQKTAHSIQKEYLKHTLSQLKPSQESLALTSC